MEIVAGTTNERGVLRRYWKVRLDVTAAEDRDAEYQWLAWVYPPSKFSGGYPSRYKQAIARGYEWTANVKRAVRFASEADAKQAIERMGG